jgi:hypothetical protein
MRKQIIAVIAATITLLAMSPLAISGERYYRERMSPEEAYVAGEAIKMFGNILGEVIANSGRRNRDVVIYYDAPRPRYHKPRRHYSYEEPTWYCKTRHGWVDKFMYESTTGRGCPGKIRQW